MSILMTISLCIFFASLPAQAFDKNFSIVSNLSGTIYSVCFGLRYYGDGLKLAAFIMALGLAYIGLALLFEWIDGDGHACVIIRPGQTIVGGTGDE